MRTHHQHTGWDRVRGVEIGHKNFKVRKLTRYWRKIKFLLYAKMSWI